MTLRSKPLSPKNIYLARHAKSSWSSMARNDFDRPLSNRGFNDAQRMGGKISQLGWNPDRVISSPALRAQQTSKALLDQMKPSSYDILWNKDIYAEYMVTLLHILNQQSETIKSIMLMGHNPAMEDLLLHFCGEDIWKNHAQIQNR